MISVPLNVIYLLQSMDKIKSTIGKHEQNLGICFNCNWMSEHRFHIPKIMIWRKTSWNSGGKYIHNDAIYNVLDY